jgi:hypothetical protein
VVGDHSLPDVVAGVGFRARFLIHQLGFGHHGDVPRIGREHPTLRSS